MTYHHTPGHPVADIYAEYLRVSEFRQAFMDLGKRRESYPKLQAGPRRDNPHDRPDQSAHAAEHPIEAEEGWLGGTDSESDDPGGWTR